MATPERAKPGKRKAKALGRVSKTPIRENRNSPKRPINQAKNRPRTSFTTPSGKVGSSAASPTGVAKRAANAGMSPRKVTPTRKIGVGTQRAGQTINRNKQINKRQVKFKPKGTTKRGVKRS